MQAAGSTALYLLFYYPQTLIDMRVFPLCLSQILVVLGSLISPTSDSIWLGMIWALLLVANAIVATGTRIGEVLDSKKLLVISFWGVSIYSVYNSFQRTGGVIINLTDISNDNIDACLGRKISECARKPF